MWKLIALLVPMISFAADVTPLARAKRLVPEGAKFRLVMGSAADCPSEEVMLWREDAGQPYLQLTPSVGLFGFEHSEWTKIPENALGKECEFLVRVDITDTSLTQRERHQCKKPRLLREVTRTIERVGERRIRVVLANATTTDAKLPPPVKIVCELQVQR